LFEKFCELSEHTNIFLTVYWTALSAIEPGLYVYFCGIQKTKFSTFCEHKVTPDYHKN